MCTRLALNWLSLQSKVLFDVPRKRLLNVGMTGDGLRLASGRIEVDIMPRAVALQHTARRFKLPDQLTALHSAISFV